jgi:hypothetical protein
MRVFFGRPMPFEGQWPIVLDEAGAVNIGQTVPGGMIVPLSPHAMMSAMDESTPLVRLDWSLLERLADVGWVEIKRRLGPEAGIQLGEDLRQHALLVRPDWPDPDERARDLDALTKLSELFRLADAHSRR